MSNTAYMRNRVTGVYFQVSRSRMYPEQSTKQLSKKYAEFNSCGRMTVGRVSRNTRTQHEDHQNF